MERINKLVVIYIMIAMKAKVIENLLELVFKKRLYLIYASVELSNHNEIIDFGGNSIRRCSVESLGDSVKHEM